MLLLRNKDEVEQYAPKFLNLSLQSKGAALPIWLLNSFGFF